MLSAGEPASSLSGVASLALGVDPQLDPFLGRLQLSVQGLEQALWQPPDQRAQLLLGPLHSTVLRWGLETDASTPGRPLFFPVHKVSSRF